MNKSSAVAEMGDRGHNRHGPKRGGLLCPFWRVELGPRLRSHLNQVASSPTRHLATTDEPKTGAVHLLERGSWVPI